MLWDLTSNFDPNPQVEAQRADRSKGLNDFAENNKVGI